MGWVDAMERPAIKLLIGCFFARVFDTMCSGGRFGRLCGVLTLACAVMVRPMFMYVFLL